MCVCVCVCAWLHWNQSVCMHGNGGVDGEYAFFPFFFFFFFPPVMLTQIYVCKVGMFVKLKFTVCFCPQV